MGLALACVFPRAVGEPPTAVPFRYWVEYHRRLVSSVNLQASPPIWPPIACLPLRVLPYATGSPLAGPPVERSWRLGAGVPPRAAAVRRDGRARPRDGARRCSRTAQSSCSPPPRGSARLCPPDGFLAARRGCSGSGAGTALHTTRCWFRGPARCWLPEGRLPASSPPGGKCWSGHSCAAQPCPSCSWEAVAAQRTQLATRLQSVSVVSPEGTVTVHPARVPAAPEDCGSSALWHGLEAPLPSVLRGQARSRPCPCLPPPFHPAVVEFAPLSFLPLDSPTRAHQSRCRGTKEARCLVACPFEEGAVPSS